MVCGMSLVAIGMWIRLTGVGEVKPYWPSSWLQTRPDDG